MPCLNFAAVPLTDAGVLRHTQNTFTIGTTAVDFICMLVPANFYTCNVTLVPFHFHQSYFRSGVNGSVDAVRVTDVLLKGAPVHILAVGWDANTLHQLLMLH